MFDLLLVSGSRALAETPAAQWWAKAKVLEALSRLSAGGTLVTGDALGPDAWARRAAIAVQVRALVFNLYGKVETDDAGWRWTTESIPAHGSPERRRWPLRRNEAMVTYVSERAFEGKRVHVLGLVAPWSKTRGTHYTVHAAAGAAKVLTGITVESHDCPGEFGPVPAREAPDAS